MLTPRPRLLLCLSAWTALCASMAGALEFGPGDWLERLHGITPPPDLPAYRQKAYECYGTQWAGSITLGGWHSARTDTGSHHRGYSTLNLQLLQRLIQDDADGGTWLRVSASAKLALTRASRHADGLGECGAECAAAEWNCENHRNNGIPEISITHFLNGKRTCLVAGVVDVGRYMDYLCSSGGYAHGIPGGTSIIPLPNSNPGVLLQQELGNNNIIQVALCRTGCSAQKHQNPLSSEHHDGFDLIAEYAHWLGESTELRFSPFYRHISSRPGMTYKRDTGGIAASIDADINDYLSFFTRAGFTFHQMDGPAAELSGGLDFYPFRSKPDDFLGIGFGVVKGEPPYEPLDVPSKGSTGHRREYVAELLYYFHLNDHCAVVPHAEYIFRPAYAATSGESVVGAMFLFTF